jgi:hypothetical protein
MSNVERSKINVHCHVKLTYCHCNIYFDGAYLFVYFCYEVGVNLRQSVDQVLVSGSHLVPMTRFFFPSDDCGFLDMWYPL